MINTEDMVNTDYAGYNKPKKLSNQIKWYAGKYFNGGIFLTLTFSFAIAMNVWLFWVSGVI